MKTDIVGISAGPCLPVRGVRMSLLLGPLCMLTLTGCRLHDLLSAPEPEGEPVVLPVLLIVSGNAQSDTVAATLAAPYVVSVVDDEGEPLPGVAVQWTVTSGDGTIKATAPVTDEDGIARATHTLGSIAGPQSVAATVASALPVTFTAMARHGRPHEIVFVQPPTTTPPGDVIAPPVTVRVQDRFGNPTTTWDGAIRVYLAPLTGFPLATLSGTRIQTPTNAVATFADLSINFPGLRYRLRVEAGELTVDSPPFDVR